MCKRNKGQERRKKTKKETDFIELEDKRGRERKREREDTNSEKDEKRVIYGTM